MSKNQQDTGAERNLPLSTLPGFTPLPSDPALLTGEQIAAICDPQQVEGVMRDLFRLIRQRSTASTVARNGAANGE